jgi:hypothetical protein
MTANIDRRITTVGSNTELDFNTIVHEILFLLANKHSTCC